MNTRVVCFSHTTGSGAEQVARAVAQELRFRFVDDEIITKAAEKAGVDPETVARAEHRQPLLVRLLDALRTTAPVAGAFNYLSPEPMAVDYYYHLLPSPKPPVDTEDYRALIRDVIREVATEGEVVILAHAASVALGREVGTLRVLVTASPETRIDRLSAAGQMLNHEEAATTVAESDKARQFYFSSFYGIKEESPTLYDLVVNTDMFTLEQVVKIIVSIARL